MDPHRPSSADEELARWLREQGLAVPEALARRTSGSARTHSWRDALAPALAPGPPSAPPRPLGLLLLPREYYDYRRRSAGMSLGIRPVTVSASGNWVRGEITWRDIVSPYPLEGVAPPAAAALRAIARLADYDPYDDEWIDLDGLDGVAFWDALDEAVAAGVELRHAGRKTPPVVYDPTPVTPVVDVVAQGRGLRLRPAFLRGDERVEVPHFVLAGSSEPGGLCTWQGGADDLGESSRLELLRFRVPADAAFVAAVRQGGIVVPTSDRDEFVSAFLPGLAAATHVTSSDGAVEVPARPRPVLVLHLSIDDSATPATPGAGAVRVSGRWAWRSDLPSGEAEESSLRVYAASRHHDGDHETVVFAGVAAALDAATAAGVPDRVHPRAGDRFSIAGLDAARFVADVVPLIAAVPDVEIARDAALPSYRTPEAAPVVSLEAGPGDARDWFDLHVSVAVDGREVPFEQLFTALALGDEVLVLDDGTYLALDDEVFARLRDLIEEARQLGDPRRPERLRISAFQEQLWDDLAEIATVARHAEEWQRAVDRVRRFDTTDPDGVPVPGGLATTLRDYQRAGFVWLDRLAQAGLGGVLADDMGLGKTMQLLTMILADRERRPDGPPHLVVAPTSVVGNWAHEAARFAPGLRVVTVETLAARRGHRSIAQVADEADVVVTSYGLLRQEAEQYAAVDWATAIADEAQAVKNPATRTYRAVRDLHAGAVFCVTGTPLENSLLDLWALLGLAAPGLFPSLERFTAFYRTPIEREGDVERLRLLHRRLQPLMLRRTKEQVAVDLPPRIEQVLEVTLNPAHRRLYDTYLHRERQRVLGLLDDMEGNRFEIFRSLTLLRRLALDPALIDESHADIPSSKLDVLDDLVETIVADGHRALVFSQFTSFLAVARRRLDAAGIRYEYLDGSTTRRADVIRRFREDDAPVFLISLKAGGFGLTLTEADYCIMLDPWWNPAVEQQAVDRAHRIGQTRSVYVYRMVATGTIEEKVMALKAEKARLFDSVVGDADLGRTSLSAADIRGLLA